MNAWEFFVNWAVPIALTVGVCWVVIVVSVFAIKDISDYLKR